MCSKYWSPKMIAVLANNRKISLFPCILTLGECCLRFNTITTILTLKIESVCSNLIFNYYYYYSKSHYIDVRTTILVIVTERTPISQRRFLILFIYSLYNYFYFSFLFSFWELSLQNSLYCKLTLKGSN